MKLSFENLGALDKGEIELADFTIVCGENNTGKTYVTYALYCLLKTWKRLINLHLSKEFAELRRSGVVRIDAQEKIVNEWPVISQSVLERFHNAFPEMLASKSDLFKSAKLNFLKMAVSKHKFMMPAARLSKNLLRNYRHCSPPGFPQTGATCFSKVLFPYPMVVVMDLKHLISIPERA